MKELKIFITSFLIITIINFSVVPFNSILASGVISLTVGNAIGRAGDNVNISINISQNSAMSAATFFLNYDSAKLECISATAGSILSTGMSDVVKDSANHKINLAYINIDPMNSAGSILDIQFKIKDGVSVSKSDLTLTVDELTDNAYNKLSYSVTQGNIQIVTQMPTPTATPIAVASVKLNKLSASLKVSQTLQLTATVSPTNATNKLLKWTSSNTRVATVLLGKVIAKGRGIAYITVKTTSGSKTAVCKVTVIQPVKSVKLNKTILTLKKGKTYKLVATVNPSNTNNKRVTWKSGNRAIALVSSKGIVKGIRKGTVYVYVYTVDGKKSAKCKIIVG